MEGYGPLICLIHTLAGLFINIFLLILAMVERLIQNSEDHHLAPPKTLIVPGFSPQVTEQRARAGFDMAIAAVIKEFKPPPKAELDALKKMVGDASREWGDTHPGKDFDLDIVVAQYTAENPSSVVAKYRDLVGNSNWLITNTNKFGFNPPVLAGQVREASLAVKNAVVPGLVTLADPQNRRINFSLEEVPSDLALALYSKLVPQYQNGQNRLPVELTYDPEDHKLGIASLLPVPAQKMEFKD